MSLCNFAKNPSIDSKVPIFKLNLLKKQTLQPQLSLLSVISYYCCPTSLHLRYTGLLTVPWKYQACSHLTFLAWMLSSLWNALLPSISDMLEFQISALVSIWERPPVTVSDQRSPTTVKRSQEIGIGLVYRPYSDFTSFYMQCFLCLVCVCCSMQFYPMYLLMEPPPK